MRLLPLRPMELSYCIHGRLRNHEFEHALWLFLRYPSAKVDESVARRLFIATTLVDQDAITGLKIASRSPSFMTRKEWNDLLRVAASQGSVPFFALNENVNLGHV